MKRFLAFLLTAVMLLSAVPFTFAAEPTNDGQAAAEKLHALGLLAGIGKNADGSVNFDVGGKLTRAQAITQIVRFLGMEKTATASTYTHPFTDLPAWAVPYVGYAYTNGITKGVSATKFGTDDRMADASFLTLILRVLGYDDSKGDFVWNNPYTLAKTAGLIDNESADGDFTRGDAFIICYRALTATVKSGDKICDRLVKSGAVSAAVMEDVMQFTSSSAVTTIGGKPITEFKIVLSVDATANDSRVANEIITAVQKQYGVTLATVTDDTAATDGEIVVGNTARAISAKHGDLGSNLASLVIEGKTVALGGASNTVLRRLSSYFVRECIEAPKALTDADSVKDELLLNPVRATPSAGDPCIVWDPETEYYYAVYSAPKNDRVTLYRVKNIADLATAEGKDVYVAGDDKEIKYKLYAPEIKKMDGKWYIYASGATKTKAEEAGQTASRSIRLFCLEAQSADPFGEYKFKAFLNDTLWAIDAHPFTYKGVNYIACARILSGNVITVARLENPWTIDIKRVSVIATATYPFETQDGKINEGPFTFESPDGRLFLLYSANSVTSNFYSLGLLELTGDDVLSKPSWTKHETAVFAGTDAILSPGHCSVFRSPDGSEYWLAYHYRNKAMGVRSLSVQPFTFVDGQPVFGEPLSQTEAFFPPSGEQ